MTPNLIRSIYKTDMRLNFQVKIHISQKGKIQRKIGPKRTTNRIPKKYYLKHK